MDNSQGQASESEQILMRDYQDRITCALYEAIYELDAPCREALLEGQARSCVTAFVELIGLPGPTDLDSFLDAVEAAGTSQADIRREGDVIHWTERHGGRCVCPFVRRQVIRLDPKLCTCSAYWMKHLFQKVANTPVEVEIGETVATGAENCRFRIALKRGAVPREEAVV